MISQFDRLNEGYVSWERAEAIRKMVSDNVTTGRHHGAPEHGDALLAGLVRCRRCGRRLTVRYTGAKHNIPHYSCWQGRLDNGMLARLNRAGELTPGWVPDTDHAAMRDLIRLRSAVRQVVTRARQHLQGFPLRHGHTHERGTAGEGRLGLQDEAGHWPAQGRPGRGAAKSRSRYRVEGASSAVHPISSAGRARKNANVVVPALAREMVGFIWSIACKVQSAPKAA